MRYLLLLSALLLAGCEPSRYHAVRPVQVETPAADFDVKLVEDAFGGLSAWVTPSDKFGVIWDDAHNVNRAVVEAALVAARARCIGEPRVLNTSSPGEVYTVTEVRMSCSREGAK